MKSFVAHTDEGDAVIVLKENWHHRNVQVYVYGISYDNTENAFPEFFKLPASAKTWHVNPDFGSVFEAVKDTITFHYKWKNEDEFKTWLNTFCFKTAESFLESLEEKI